ncbi:MAG: nitroreductase family protein [Bacillota bacterium]|jgi:nitroreductase|nr:nitroreductase family protein [Bacillota bacterium]MDI9415825.1 nitroreductase family protein [Bacillota bacterium]HOB88540.1 nitroreductase family protein [Bacillota bacterium]HOJ57214.1 nitroreductase family protein [Bacillota bacterium]HOL01394.1 nitroreductase family protein [Bacillota bacterium]
MRTLTTDLFEVIEKRRSERHFKPDPVSGDAIKRILECGLRAPTAGNIQPWQFIVVKRPELKEDLARAAFGQRFVSDAPVVIVVAADPQRSARTYGTRGAELYSIQDTAAAVQNMLLAVVALGLGACWVGAFDEKAAARVLELPAHLRPVAMIPIGYTKERPMPRRPRSDRPWEETVVVLE